MTAGRLRLEYTSTYFQRKYLPPRAPLPGQPISSSQRLDQLDQFVKDRKLLESEALSTAWEPRPQAQDKGQRSPLGIPAERSQKRGSSAGKPERCTARVCRQDRSDERTRQGKALTRSSVAS